MNTQPDKSPFSGKTKALPVVFALIGIIFFVAASALLVMSKNPETAGTPLIAALAFLAVAACWRTSTV
jgi:hypothetical protein